ncbi:MAG: ATP-dependent dethiobiotin synthetase BioD [Bacteroidales bacterium]|nr:ATP-dependent dethiobiotin synthetase BioD [Bacteroidales bacterium]
MNQAYFISGIDTDAGKTYCTAWLAKKLIDEGHSVITQKFIQTGCKDSSEDIEAHRRLTGQPMQPEDLDGTTAPLIYTHPCSPQLAARIDGRDIPLEIIDRSTRILLEKYDRVLIEGAGGLMVPITDTMFTIDYVASRELPLVLVVHGGLGSINHIVLSLEAIKKRGIVLHSLLYNRYFDSDPLIAADTHGFIERYIAREFPDTPIYDVPAMRQ